MNDKLKLTIVDEVNVKFDNLTPSDIKFIQTKTAKYVKGYFQSAAYKHKFWDGKETQFADDGSTYYYMLDTVLPLLEQLGFILDKDLDIVDLRPSLQALATIKPIDDKFLSAYGISMRHFQVDSINAIIKNPKGLIQVGTSGGKTFIASAIAKVFESLYRTLVIVPNDNLGTAMVKHFKHIGLDVAFVNADIPKAKRNQVWQNHKHIVVTWQTLNRNRDYLKDFGAFVYDETHIMGAVMFAMFVKELAHCPVRIGMTGTVPEDKQKREKIFTRIGGELLYTIETKQLADEGWVSKSMIHMVKIHHPKKEIDAWMKMKGWQELPWEWDMEEKFLNTNKDRIDTIVQFLNTLPLENTLILCTPELGSRLAVALNVPFIDGTVNPDARLLIYELFNNHKNVRVVATWGTVGTGISIDDIFTGVLIDAGKDKIKIMQGIGRMLRLDSEKRNFVNIWDIYSDTHYSMKHRGTRTTLYREKEFDHDPVAKTLGKQDTISCT